MTDTTFEDDFDSLVNESETDDQFEEQEEVDSDQGDEYGEVQAQEEVNEPDDAERYRQEVEQWKHRYNSDIGRINAYQRKIQELEQQLHAQPPAASQANPEGSGMTDDEWQMLKEDFPEIASALEKQLSSQSQAYEARLQQMQQHMQSQLQPIQEQAYNQFKQTQFQILEQQHPDWRDIAQTKEFRSWLNTQPAPVQELITSDSAADAAYLIQSYKAGTGYSAANSHDDLRARRQQQLRQAQTLPTRGARRTSDVPDDYEAAFNFFADKG